MYWKTCFRQGKRYLSTRNPETALDCFEKALQRCPVGETEHVANLLYYCGLTLEMMGAGDTARECLRSSSYIGENGSLSNRDRKYRTFRAVQTAGYFRFKGAQSFDSEEEFRRVTEIIDAYWREVEQSGLPDEVSADDFLYLCYELSIDFLRWLPEYGKNSSERTAGKGRVGRIIEFRTDNPGE